MRARAIALLVAVTSTANAEPQTYASADFRASTTQPIAGTYDYTGFDVHGGRRLISWLAVEGFYAADIGHGAYAYPADCAQMCCGSHLRSWNMEEFGARVVFVPLHFRAIDVSAGIGVAAVLAHETSVPSHAVPESLGCGGAFYGWHGAIAASTFASLEVRPVRHVGLRVTGTFAVADVEDFPMFQFSVGPVFWF
jgi:hypothetical protein